MLHIPLTNHHLLAAKQEPYQKACLLTKNTEEFSGKKRLGEWATRQKKREEKKDKKDRESDGSRQKNKTGYSKMESNEIPDKEETSDIPGLPSG